VLLNAPALKGSLARIVETHRPDVVLAYCSGMARLALDPPLTGVPFVLDMVDVDSEKWRSLEASAHFPRNWVFRREARLLRRFEALATRRAATTLVVNERERETLAGHARDGQIVVLANGVDVDNFRPPSGPAHAQRVIFCGVMNYGPNEEAAIWLARHVWPIVRARRPDARLALVGSMPTGPIKAIPFSDPTISVTGAVPDVRVHLWRSAIAVAPLLIARGVQNKVLEAAAAGLPSVVTSTVAAGLPPEVMPACRIADTPKLFAEQIIKLLDSPGDHRRAIAQQARLETLTWSRQLSGLRSILEHAATQCKGVSFSVRANR
jgi:glycosyltransferase involved in cell wall biosynthesis